MAKKRILKQINWCLQKAQDNLYNINNNKNQILMNINKWFSTIIVILIVSFLVILSSWILNIILQESKNTRLVFNMISTYAWAEWALEYALLKLKNHKNWFEDSVKYNTDYDSKLLFKDTSNFIFNKDQIIEYEIDNFATDYTWSINPWSFEIISLFFDSWSLIQVNSKNPNLNTSTSNIIKTNSFKFTWKKSWWIETVFTWNIIWNDVNWNTFWIVWTWQTNESFWTWYTDIIKSLWSKKYTETDTDFTNAQQINFEKWIDIWKFLNTYNNNYLIIYNSSPDKLDYNITSNEWFSLSKTSIITSSKIWNFKQNIQFTQDKSQIFEMLKYSLFN